jgi:hypothetical protein
MTIINSQDQDLLGNKILLKLDTKIDHHSKLCSLFLKFSKWPPFQNGRQYKNKKNPTMFHEV